MGSNADTHDHHVPRMYLRRFAKERSNGAEIIAVTPDLEHHFRTGVRAVGAERGFYWGTDADGVPHHHMEKFLQVIEADAASAFRRVLDSGRAPSDDALPSWPPRSDVRLRLSWWIAAQILRTVRQRRRLDTAHSEGAISVPSGFESANRHIRYIAELIEDLASSIFFRPWGVGFSDYCLLTGDVPVLVINGQDDADQGAAVEYWDVFLPLDPHRCLFLPGAGASGRQLPLDHRFKLHPGHALALNGALINASVRHVFHHPDHDPTPRAEPQKLSNDGELPQMILNYELLPRDHGVERRWLDTHPTGRVGDGDPMSDADVIEHAELLISELGRRTEEFDRYRHLRSDTAEDGAPAPPAGGEPAKPAS